MSSPGGTSWLGRFAAGGLSKPVPPTQQQQQQQQHGGGGGGGGGHSAAPPQPPHAHPHHPPQQQQHHEPPTPETQKKVAAAKTYIENLYKNQAKSIQERMDRRMSLEKNLAAGVPAEAKEAWKLLRPSVRSIAVFIHPLAYVCSS